MDSVGPATTSPTVPQAPGLPIVRYKTDVYALGKMPIINFTGVCIAVCCCCCCCWGFLVANFMFVCSVTITDRHALLFVQLLSVLGREAEADVTSVRARLKATAALLPLLFMSSQPASLTFLLVGCCALSLNMFFMDGHRFDVQPLSVRTYWTAQQDRIPGLRSALGSFPAEPLPAPCCLVSFKRRFGVVAPGMSCSSYYCCCSCSSCCRGV